MGCFVCQSTDEGSDKFQCRQPKTFFPWIKRADRFQHYPLDFQHIDVSFLLRKLKENPFIITEINAALEEMIDGVLTCGSKDPYFDEESLDVLIRALLTRDVLKIFTIHRFLEPFNVQVLLGHFPKKQ